MNLSEMLSYADISQLSSIAQQYGCDCSGHSKHELIQSILSNVSRKEVISRALEGLGLEERRFLNYLLFEKLEAFSLEDLLARVQQCRFDTPAQVRTSSQASKPTISSPTLLAHEWSSSSKPSRSSSGQKQSEGSNKQLKTTKKSAKKSEQQVAPLSPREMIVRFKSQGWLFNGHRAQDRYLFHVPEDFRLSYRLMMLRQMQKAVVYTEIPSAIEDESGQLLSDMAVMIDYMLKHQPSASADGVIHKRAIQQLNELLAVKEQMPSKGAWKFGYGKGFGELPERMTLLYDFMWSKKWLLLQDNVIVINEAKLPQTHIMQHSLLKEIIMHWIKRYRTPIPNMRALLYWVMSLSSSWCSLQSLETVLLPYIKPYYFDAAPDILHKRIIKPLKHFGMLQTGQCESDGVLLQATLYGKRMVNELYS